jgi:DNA modification methylase
MVNTIEQLDATISNVKNIKKKRIVDTDRRANQLNGKDWLKNSISVWNDLSKSKEEKIIKHPAAFPEMMVSRLILSFLNKKNAIILDPFLGSGSTLSAAVKLGHDGIGFEIYSEYIIKAETRLEQFKKQYTIINDSAINICKYVKHESVDMVVTSPPYWNILNRNRTADYKNIRFYGTDNSDLGNIDEYHAFLDSLMVIMRGVYTVLRPRSYCVVNVMDIRIKDKLYTLHSDIYTRMESIGFQLDDIIIWDRRSEYNNLRPLGYPYKFRLNRVHEYLLIFYKDK